MRVGGGLPAASGGRGLVSARSQLAAEILPFAALGSVDEAASSRTDLPRSPRPIRPRRSPPRREPRGRDGKPASRPTRGRPDFGPSPDRGGLCYRPATSPPHPVRIKALPAWTSPRATAARHRPREAPRGSIPRCKADAPHRGGRDRSRVRAARAPRSPRNAASPRPRRDWESTSSSGRPGTGVR